VTIRFDRIGASEGTAGHHIQFELIQFERSGRPGGRVDFGAAGAVPIGMTDDGSSKPERTRHARGNTRTGRIGRDDRGIDRGE
jgi:hypothetical protein